MQTAFLIVVQSPTLEFQVELLPTIKEAAERGQLPLKAYAALVDRVRLKEGKPQVYGTQAQYVGAEIVIGPIEDAEWGCPRSRYTRRSWRRPTVRLRRALSRQHPEVDSIQAR